MAFAQLTYRESLRDIEACLRSLGAKLYHIGIPLPGGALHTGRRHRVAATGGSMPISPRS